MNVALPTMVMANFPLSFDLSSCANLRDGVLQRVGAAVGPESFRLHIELSQQVFNDISLGGTEIWVSQILKSAEFCPQPSSHIFLPSFTPPSSFQRC